MLYSASSSATIQFGSQFGGQQIISKVEHPIDLQATPLFKYKNMSESIVSFICN